ncbi:MAG: hypothetical protein IPM70_14170 [Proteobacteria bacterium]|nr:hypothetical protein [Pseudomonadota bacterium]
MSNYHCGRRQVPRNGSFQLSVLTMAALAASPVHAAEETAPEETPLPASRKVRQKPV